MLLLGDCLEELKKVEDKSVDMCILDLPFGITAAKWDTRIDLDKLWVQLKRVAKSDRTPFFFFATFIFGAEILKSNPKWFGFEIIWSKKTMSNPFTARYHHSRSHENIYVFYKKAPIYNYNLYHTKELKGIRKTPRKTSVLSGGIYDQTGFQDCEWTPKLPISVVEYSNNNHKKGQHPTKKPEVLLEHLIKYYSNEDDIILDPTFGGGSTIKACITLNRKYIGIEQNKVFFDKLSKEINS